MARIQTLFLPATSTGHDRYALIVDKCDGQPPQPEDLDELHRFAKAVGAQDVLVMPNLTVDVHYGGDDEEPS